MKSIMKERKASSIMAALVCIALGVVLIMWPDLSVHWLCMALGGVLVFSGAVYLISHFTKKNKLSMLQLDLVLGIILAILGAWLLFNPDSVVTFIQFVFGALIIIHGLLDMQSSFSLISAHDSRWWTAFVLALVTIAMGAVIILNPFATFSTLVMLIGGVLIFDGLSDLFIVFWVSHVFKKLEREITAAETIETTGSVTDAASAEKGEPVSAVDVIEETSAEIIEEQSADDDTEKTNGDGGQA